MGESKYHQKCGLKVGRENEFYFYVYNCMMDLSPWMSCEIPNSVQSFSLYIALFLIFPFLPPLLSFTHSSFFKKCIKCCASYWGNRLMTQLLNSRSGFLYLSSYNKRKVDLTIIILSMPQEYLSFVISFFIKLRESISIFLLPLPEFRHQPLIVRLLQEPMYHSLKSNLPCTPSILAMAPGIIILNFGGSHAL